eukprot:9376004-Heterocapsa_arctica.AAC.1
MQTDVGEAIEAHCLDNGGGAGEGEAWLNAVGQKDLECSIWGRDGVDEACSHTEFCHAALQELRVIGMSDQLPIWVRIWRSKQRLNNHSGVHVNVLYRVLQDTREKLLVTRGNMKKVNASSKSKCRQIRTTSS